MGAKICKPSNIKLYVILFLVIKFVSEIAAAAMPPRYSHQTASRARRAPQTATAIENNK